MSWKILYTEQAQRDLDDIYGYIADVLLEPAVAKSLIGAIVKNIRTLNEMPMRCRLYDGEPWHSKGLRFLPVKNYIVFYLPNETDNTVTVVRIMFGGRDINNQLNKS